ncbi:MAG: hypothetical protein AB7P35_17730 [Hyphomonadaceae bacterium]
MTDQLASPAPAGQGADGATPQAPPPAASDLASPPGPPTPPPEPETFVKSISNAELRGYLEVKGFKGVTAEELLENVVGSYRALEKMRGVPAERLLTLPENLEDAEAMRPIYERLGLAAPETSDAYGFVTMEGADPTFAKAAEDAFHKAGIPPRYAKAMAEWWNGYSAQMQGAVLKEAEEETALELGRLKAEWGGGYDEKVEKARRAVRHLGLSEEHLQSIETATGAADLYRVFASAHDRMGLAEAAFVEGGAKNSGFALTPEAAKIKIEELKSNREWAGRYLAGDKAAIAEMRRLQEIAHPGVVQ